VNVRFLGTRGEIERRTDRHELHSSLLVAYRSSEVMIDCGLDWLEAMSALRPTAIVLTHAHPDHAAGLRQGAPCPVFATEVTWGALRRYPVREREVAVLREPLHIGGIGFEAFDLEHSLRAPAVGYRITAGQASLFYAPDVVSIHDEREALDGIGVYIGDGAAVTRSIVRRRDGALIGHVSIRTRLDWCAAADVPRAIFSHCGSEIVRDHERAVDKVEALGHERGVEAKVAFDGMEFVVRSRSGRPKERGLRG
jgi:phosphoribosyl 1,2-cyclic phosphodiesterase